MASADTSAGGQGTAAELVFDHVTKRYAGRSEPKKFLQANGLV